MIWVGENQKLATLINNDNDNKTNNNNNNYSYYYPLLHAKFFQWFHFVWFGFFLNLIHTVLRLEMLRFQK